MKAIITGATGFLGAHLVELLEQQGYNIIALGRNLAKGEQLISEKTQFKSTDISHITGLENVFEEADVVFHCAGLSNIWGSKKAFHLANVEGTRNVLRCCEKNNIKRLVYVSSTSVYFDYRDKVNIHESDSIANEFANEYAKTKFLAEELLLAESKNTEIVIIRPRGIVGDGDTSIMPRILRVANKGFFPLVNQGRAVVDLTYVKNVAYALFLAGEKPNIHGKRYNISNLEPLSVKTLLQRVFYLRQQKQCLFIPINYSLIYGLAWCFEKIASTLSLSEPSITRYSIGLLSKTQTLNVQAAQNDLGYKPIYSLDDAIQKYIDWEKK